MPKARISTRQRCRDGAAQEAEHGADGGDQGQAPGRDRVGEPPADQDPDHEGRQADGEDTGQLGIADPEVPAQRPGEDVPGEQRAHG